MIELRQQALTTVPRTAEREVRRANAYERSEAVRVYVLRRANGTCEGCRAAAPFLTSRNRPYLEPHHIRRLADGGPDHPRWVAALCPNCHRRVHHAHDGDAFNKAVAKYVGTLKTGDS
jgi:5-methylcytosine-specific restriction enzyme A